MDKAQVFIKECLFSRNFDNPNKPFEDQRLQETLLLLPTDGGATSKLKKNKNQLKLTTENIHTYDNKSHSEFKQDNYRDIKKSARVELHNYIKQSRKSVMQAKKLIAENSNFSINSSKDTIDTYLQNNHQELWNRIPHYSSFLTMHEALWIPYIKELLNINPSGESSTGNININGSAALLKLSMADYNSAFLKVIKCKNSTMIGIKGIVIWDGQKSFIMICKGRQFDEIKIIPKKGTVFSFEVPINDEFALQYSILGDRFNYRSSDRAGRKFKSRRCDDMLYYINK